MKRKYLFLSIAGIQSCVFFLYACSVIARLLKVQDRINKHPVLMVVLIIVPLLLIVFSVTCIYIVQKNLPDRVFTKTLNSIYRFSSAVFLVGILFMVVFSFVCLSDIFTAISYPDYPTTLHRGILFDSCGIILTISMFYLMATAIRLKKLIYYNAAVKQAQEINALGEGNAKS